MLDRNPRDVEATHLLGLIAYRDGLFSEADRYLTAAIAAAPERGELYGNHAAILRSLGRLADAEAAARAGIALNPKGAEGFSNLGNILRDAGRYDQAIACFQAAVRAVATFYLALPGPTWRGCCR